MRAIKPLLTVVYRTYRNTWISRAGFQYQAGDPAAE